MSAGVTFAERMTGLLSMGEKDPVAGYHAPGATGVVFDARVTIADLDAFLDDPGHVGALSAVVDIPRWGGRFTSGPGRFELFAPTDSARATRMSYSLPITVDGVAHTFAGSKTVRVGPPWRLWPDTTTLHTTVHEAPAVTGLALVGEPSGMPVAAGLMRITVPALFDMAGTVHGVGPGRLARAAAVSRFLGFFAGGLTSTYLLRRRA